MDEGIIHISNSSVDAASFTDINYNDCAFVLTVMPSCETVSINLRDICEPDGGSAKLTTLTCKALYDAVNEDLNKEHVTPTSHSLSDSSRSITDDDQLQELLALERPYQKLFRFYFDPNPDASVNHAHPKSKSPDCQSPRKRSNQTSDIVLPFFDDKDHTALDIDSTRSHSDYFISDSEEDGVEGSNHGDINAFLFAEKSRPEFEQFSQARWEHIKRAYSQKEPNLDLPDKSSLERCIYDQQAYTAMCMVKSEDEFSGVLLADVVGVGETSSCWLALATIAMINSSRRKYSIAMRCDETGPSDLNCPAVDEGRIFNTRPKNTDEAKLPTLIVVPPRLIYLWEKEYLKYTSHGTIEIRKTHLEELGSFTDLYQPLERDGAANDHFLGHIVVLTSEECFNNGIMRKNTYNQYAPEEPGQRRPRKIGRIQFARVLVGEAHDIRHVNSALTKNLMKLAEDGASIWFITGKPFSTVATRLVDFMKCWDATALAKQTREPLTPRLIEIERDYNKAFSRMTAAEMSGRKDLVKSAKEEMNLKIRDLSEITHKLGIEQWDDTFHGKMILSLSPPKLSDEWVGFLSDSWSHKYQKFYCQDLDKIEDGPSANQGRPDLRSLVHMMRMSCIYASIPGLLDIPGCWSEDDLKKAWEKSRQNQSSMPDNANYHPRAFDASKIDDLFQSSGKLQRLVEISKGHGIGEEIPQPEDGNGSRGTKMMVIFAATMVECEIIEWALRDKTKLRIASLHHSSHGNNRTRDTYEDDTVLRPVDVIVVTFQLLSKVLSLMKAQLVVVWAPQWLSTKEEEAQAEIYRIGQEFGTEIIRLIGEGTIDKHAVNIQRQGRGFDVRVLGVRVNGQKVMSRKEQLASLEEHGQGRVNIENHGLSCPTSSELVLRLQEG